MPEGGVRRGGAGWDVGWVVGPRAEPSRLAPRPSHSRLVSGAGGLDTSGSGVAGSGVGSSDVRSLGSSSSSSSALPPPPAPAPLRPACRTSCRPHQPTSKGTMRDDGGQRARGLREHERASNARASHTMRRARAYGERRRRGAGRGCRATCKVIARSHGEACRGEAGWRGRDARLRLRRRACCKGSRSAPPSCLRSVGASPSAGLAQLLLLRRLPATRRSSDAPLSAIRLSPPPRCHSDAPPSPPSALARPRQPPPATSLPFCIFPCLACQKAAKNGEIEPRGQRLHQRESRSRVVTK